MEIAKRSFEYSKSIIDTLKKNWKSIIFLFLFTFGILLGTYILKQNHDFTSTTLANILNEYISLKRGNTILDNFIASFKVNFIFVLLTFMLGFCAIGTPFITLVPVIKGIGMGLFCGYLYLNYNFSGLGYCVLIIYPGLIISLFALLSASNFSLSFSYEMLLSLFGTNNTKKKNLGAEHQLKIFCIRYIIIFIISIIGSIVDSLTIKLFSGLFNF